jgi:hypothetical protein
MRGPTRWVAFALGTGLVVSTVALAQVGEHSPWLLLAFAHGILLIILNLALQFHHPRLSDRRDDRNRVAGIALALALSALWRATLSVTQAVGPGLFAWAGSAAATLLLLLPAVFCWAYVFATLVPRHAPEPLEQSHRLRTVPPM